jgi:hypothetical protein
MMNRNEKIEDIIVRSNVPGLDVAIAKISMAKLEPSLPIRGAKKESRWQLLINAEVEADL